MWFTEQELNLGLHPPSPALTRWKCRVLATGPQAKSTLDMIFISIENAPLQVKCSSDTCYGLNVSPPLHILKF